MKKILMALILLAFIITGCINNEGTQIEYLDIDSTEGNVKQWIDSHIKSNGVFLGRFKESDKSGKYYLFVNYSNVENNEKYSVPSVSISYNAKKQMDIEVKARISDNTYEKLYYINGKKNQINRIILNGEEIKIASIPYID